MAVVGAAATIAAAAAVVATAVIAELTSYDAMMQCVKDSSCIKTKNKMLFCKI
jgi:hypothetical protein